MTTIKLRGPVDLEQLHDVCSGVSATVALRAEQNELLLTLAGEDAEGCVELLADWLESAGVELEQPIG